MTNTPKPHEHIVQNSGLAIWEIEENYNAFDWFKKAIKNDYLKIVFPNSHFAIFFYFKHHQNFFL